MTEKRLEEIKARSHAMAKLTVEGMSKLTTIQIAQMNVDIKRLTVEVDRLRAELEAASANESVKNVPEYGGSRGYRCPTCGVWFYMAEKDCGEWYNTTPFCGNCGQALDWESVTDGLGEGEEE